ncbi:MAG: tryptophan synthase subunit alpha [Cytophagales bacterium]|nr:MAG: tryptophan synthase subunit alpha [Cytophagales bacterium]
MQKRIQVAFEKNKKELLTIYYTAGFPNLNDTLTIAQTLESAGADLIEIGIPFSDPIADGEVIQQSNMVALQNGMSVSVLFEQLSQLRQHVSLPVLLMGYLNPILQYGIENFCKKASEIGIDGLIIPDLPLEEYEQHYKSIFEQYHLAHVFLITPFTSPERIAKIDELSEGFIYMVSSASITGKTQGISTEQKQYFERIANMPLKTPKQIGFGIYDRSSFQTACQYAQGAIIGSAFIKHLQANPSKTPLELLVTQFVKEIKA